jgi:hypothetical protein
MAKHVFSWIIARIETTREDGYHCKSLDARRDLNEPFRQDSGFRVAAFTPRGDAAEATNRGRWSAQFMRFRVVPRAREGHVKPNDLDGQRSMANAVNRSHCNPRITELLAVSSCGHPAETPRIEPASKCVGVHRPVPKNEAQASKCVSAI